VFQPLFSLNGGILHCCIIVTIATKLCQKHEQLLYTMAPVLHLQAIPMEDIASLKRE